MDSYLVKKLNKINKFFISKLEHIFDCKYFEFFLKNKKISFLFFIFLSFLKLYEFFAKSLQALFGKA